MSKTLTYEYVKNYFIEQSCELLEHEYINSKTKMKYICKCGNNSNIDWNHFKQGKRCMKCGGSEKLTLEYVKKFFKEQRCKLLEIEYINANSKMKYICECNNESNISWSNFKNGQRCMKCSGGEKLTFNFVKKFFENEDCILLETEYINNCTKMKYICKCGNESSIRFDNFQQGQRCRKCYNDNRPLDYKFISNFFNKKGFELITKEYKNNTIDMECKCANNHILNISYNKLLLGYKCNNCINYEKLQIIKTFFEENNCKLLDTEYNNSKHCMKYICICGNESKISFNNFKKGKRCKNCGIEKSMKSSNQFKNYTFESGKIIKIQGFEHFALDELVKIFNEDDIITKRSEMPKIIYKLKDKEHRYYPDIWIKSINKIIEIKSSYTYKYDLIKNINKALSTRKLKYDFEFWVYIQEKKNIYSKIII